MPVLLMDDKDGQQIYYSTKTRRVVNKVAMDKTFPVDEAGGGVL